MGQHHHDPYWGPPTSKANFCEEDYVMSPYFAEFWNTISNLSFVILGCIGLWKRRSDPDWTRRLGFYGLIGVGICSGVFHATLNYYTQMCDDLSMFLATAPIMHRVLSATMDLAPAGDNKQSGSNVKRKNFLSSRSLGYLITGLLAGVIAIHMTTDELLLHRLAFSAMIHIIRTRTMRLLRQRREREARQLEKKDRSSLTSSSSSSPSASQLTRYFWTGAASFAAGFLFWNIDNWDKGCALLLGWKAWLSQQGAGGVPGAAAVAVLLEFHALWHILTAVGAYYFMILSNELA